MMNLSAGAAAALLAAALLAPSAIPAYAAAPETIGGGTVDQPAVGPKPSFGLGGDRMVLVKNWHFGADGTIKNYADMNANFQYHDQFGTIGNGTNYGALMVAPDAANAINNQPIEGDACPPVRQFTSDSLKTLLTPLYGATKVVPHVHNAGCGSFMAKWHLPHGGSLLGRDIVWETRVRYVTPPYFWFAIWTAGNKWKADQKGAPGGIGSAAILLRAHACPSGSNRNHASGDGGRTAGSDDSEGPALGPRECRRQLWRVPIGHIGGDRA